MSVWVCLPSARPVAEVEVWAARWKNQGYKIALWRDIVRVEAADICIVGEYQGYSRSANALIRLVLDSDRGCDWCVATGDDTNPDPNKKADDIAFECSAHFVHQHGVQHCTFGVVQPTGDRWGDDAMSRLRWPDAPAQIDRICGSPWIGREFALRINQGQGPWWPEYHHNWADEEMLNVAKALGALWQRRDLTHYHDHARRKGGPWQAHQQHFDADYARMKPLFEERRKNGFPGSSPL